MKNKIMVIGAAGFVGSVLVQRLLEAGEKVIAVDNLYKPGDSLLSFVYNPHFEFVKCDITQYKQVARLFDRLDVGGVILLSGIVGLDACNRQSALAQAVNVQGWANVMGYKPSDIPLVAASTGSVYGEVLNGLCEEEKTPTNPLSIYGITKLDGERWVTNHGGVALRFATCAGASPNFRLNLMPNQLVYEAVTNKVINVFEKDNLRTFIDIRDFAESLYFFLLNFDRLEHDIYNVGDERNNLTKGQLAELIKKHTGCIVNYVDTFKDQDARNYAVSYERMKSARFECKYTIEDTIKSLVKSIPLLNTLSKYN